MISHDQLIKCAREALLEEGRALARAASLLGSDFIAVIDLVMELKGKLVVSGLGKSGHVARKIAATLASTGTPSFFLHPSEALHGDLGMLRPGDALLLVAFGGETRETLEVGKYAKRHSIPVLAITGKIHSTLAQLADYILDGSVDREICPLNLAPTSSTTVAMALGDALAVTLMQARGFQATDFAQFHPDGSLGRQLSQVRDHLRKLEQTLLLSDDFNTVLEVITRDNFGISPVFDRQGALVGAITDGDLRRALQGKKAAVFGLKASDLMSKSPKWIAPDRLALEAVRVMEENKITSLFVIEKSQGMLGLIRMHDLLAAKIV